MKKLVWLAFMGFAASCQIQELENPLEDEALMEDANARFKSPEGNNGPLTVPPGVEACESPAVFDLFAGQHKDVGSVTISNDSENLYVTYFTTKTLQELHLWVGSNLKDMPRNHGGNPILGHFPYKAHANNATTYTFQIPLSELAAKNIECDDNLLVVAHAEVNGNGAFGGNMPIPCFSRWAYFMTYTIVCCDDEPPGNSENAYSKGNWVFVNGGCNNSNPECLPGLGVSNTRWGWTHNFTQTTAEFYPLYASATQNDTSNGTLVGFVEIEYTTFLVNGVLTAAGSIVYFVDDDWVLERINIYAGDDRPVTSVPSQYGHSADLPSGASVYLYTIDFPNPDTANDGVWFITHAVVKPAGSN